MDASLSRRGCLGLALAVAGLGGCSRLEAPADVAYTLLDGRPGALRDLRGQVVMVNFWATSCAICVAEMPQLVATHRRFDARGLRTLAVAMSYDPPALVARYAEREKLPFGVVIDNTGAVARAFGDVRLTPTGFVLDRQGRVAHQWTGAPDLADLHRRLDRLLAAA
ncbi:MAG: TlpA disulfide reductase family protein [Rubrivivax sp.]